MLYLIAYGIAGDRRREDVATLLSGYGPRVQLSMSGCELRSRREATALGAKLRALIDAVADPVRISTRSTKGRLAASWSWERG
jgi:CRISPR-associated protein Cas2